ncbi:MAG: hypothetical protein LBS19_16500 [Clostridiales bacterium]|nr:hypothetical protein [Clostridiales bacterium]
MPDLSQPEITSLEMRNLLMDALLYENNDLGNQDVFKNHDYQGDQYVLFKLVEWLAIKHKLVEKKINPPRTAWGTSGHSLIPDKTTNFTDNEIKRFYQEFNNLLFHGIIAPGAVGGDYSLPSIHVTEYGFECLRSKEILPHDADDFLEKIKREIPNIDEWILYYVSEALKCFNANCLDASTIMLGLANEKLIKLMIESLISYLDMYYLKYNMKALQDYRKISEGYNAYKNALEHINEEKKSSQPEKAFLSSYDAFKRIESTVHSEFLRITRNEVAHPNEIRKERIETLMLFMTFIPYCKNQYEMIAYFKKSVTYGLDGIA